MTSTTPKSYPITLEMLLGPGRPPASMSTDDPDLREIVRLTSAATGVPCELVDEPESAALEVLRAEVLTAARVNVSTFVEGLACVASDYVCDLERQGRLR